MYPNDSWRGRGRGESWSQFYPRPDDSVSQGVYEELSEDEDIFESLAGRFPSLYPSIRSTYPRPPDILRRSEPVFGDLLSHERHSFFPRPSRFFGPPEPGRPPQPESRRQPNARYQPHQPSHATRQPQGSDATNCHQQQQQQQKEPQQERAVNSDDEKVGNLVCSICFEPYSVLVHRNNSIVVLDPCSHVFCRECIRPIAQSTKTCPKCRAPFRTDRHMRKIFL